ncbi:glutathione S-transferase C-terminal-like protein [Trametes versicolor FP-101664 SS1]|uniref:glutathione S-transferase C-terminal-like protein n=1 Tax=Trametes versicolor (strain FP-101664) TaxID=717944 RepID=UPI00046214B2|nr:glutathione S-transferase C-terminal-like protein [Trametes versicolor FP-101664 SS1]EIW59075.1 glutathione S-transferase C-terminal-like protein [Trametes versicolor FP-101664 SS1]
MTSLARPTFPLGAATHRLAKQATYGRGGYTATAAANSPALRYQTGGGVGRYSTATSPSAKPLSLYTWRTPNGRKVSIFLEELKAQYGLAYEAHPVDISTGVQKEPWFTRLNPNGRIPVLVDANRPSPGGDGHAVFESGAILLYLAQHYDTLRKFAADAQADPETYSEVLQWIFFTHGGIGPMQGQAGHFVRAAPEDIPYAKKRYIDETKRLYGVLDARLAGREWLAGRDGGTYSIADMNALPWVSVHGFVEIETLDEWPNVKAWVERAMERPAVKAGMQVP